MSPPVDRIASDETLPEAVDVVVIGAGIIGVAAAYHLAKKGHSVALIEKGHVGAEQSSRNWGWCRQQGRDRHEIPLARVSLEMWGNLREEIGADLGFRRHGVLWVTRDPRELAGWERWANDAREMQVHSRMLSAAEVAARLPGNTEGWIGGMETPNDGRAEPSMAAPALAAAARRLGVALFQNCAARGMETKGGAIDSVVTERGRIRTQAVLLAGGAWSTLFCRRHGIELPQAMVNGTAFRTTAAPAITEGALGTPGYCMRRREDGGYTVALRGRGTLHLTPDGLRYARQFWPTFRQRAGKLKIRIGKPFLDGLMAGASWSFDQQTPFERTRVLDPSPDMELVEEALETLAGAYPGLAGIGCAEAWGGTIDSTPDAVPVISAVNKLRGFHLATGFSGHGFGIGPGAGRLAADIVSGDAPVVDPHSYRYERLVDGTYLAPAGAL
ncbi:NAD(P)/FAD-dependent oxidoreductase [Teichococcus oryzae]|uniref:FAD-binding oxidoreductase n=1 Tax=Teichococcus oryzae TaxID=1608942 RepID=A0A5B2TEQ9_9PROT|nr:FAD-binding oxidoreductase [Pseudoroseomonas oryzae]KAA2212604.1 FAD-binding oxidoreductase [Pseudoroseomonas oryzae]